MRSTRTFEDIVSFIRRLFNSQTDFIPLHEPRFIGNERKYVVDAIDSTFVSSVGPYVNKFEEDFARIVGSKYAIAIVNGTSALHLGMIIAGVKPGDEVITQPLTFIATSNAIAYTGARPVFVDVDRSNMGMSREALEKFLKSNCILRNGVAINKVTGRKISGCVPMHTFGFPCEIEGLAQICAEWKIPLIEDAAESLGSYYNQKHTGTFGLLGTFSFNGNKTVTCGGGGAIVTNDAELAQRAKHLSTQAKVPHRWDFVHDSIGYNYRMPNINAALACAQLEQLNMFISNKRKLADLYRDFFKGTDVEFKYESADRRSNYWLNTIEFADIRQRNEFLQFSNDNNVMTRPAWTLMTDLRMFADCQHDGLENSRYLADRLVNIPSSVRV
jgi:perosamine synthetase